MDNFLKAINDAIEDMEENAPPADDCVWEEAQGESPQGVERTLPRDVPEEEAPAAPAASAPPEGAPEEEHTPPPQVKVEWKELVAPPAGDCVWKEAYRATLLVLQSLQNLMLQIYPLLSVEWIWTCGLAHLHHHLA